MGFRRLTLQGRIIGLRRKLTAGAADDQYEQEAGHVVPLVMSTSGLTASNAIRLGIPLEEDKDKTLQMVTCLSTDKDLSLK
jgi:hypothetical protein